VAKTHKMLYVAGHFLQKSTNYRALLQKINYEDKASFESLQGGKDPMDALSA